MATSGIGEMLFGADKPVAPEFRPVNYTDEQLKAAQGNLANLGKITQLGSETNLALAKQHLAMLDAQGLGDIYRQGTANLESQLRGELPKDVEDYIARKAAESGVTSGTSGSEFNKYGKLRNLGLTSLDLTQKALSSAGQWLANASIPQFNFTSMFQTPQQRVETAKWNESMRWNQQWLENQLEAMPGKHQRAYKMIFDYIATFATTAAGAGMGGIGGGAGAGAGAAGANAATGSAPGAGAGGWQGAYGGGSSWG